MDFSLIEDPVGCEQIPHQVRKRSTKRGYTFNLMFLGYDGLGKSTLINSLFRSDLVPLTQFHDPRDPGERYRDLCGKPNIKERCYCMYKKGFDPLFICDFVNLACL